MVMNSYSMRSFSTQPDFTNQRTRGGGSDGAGKTGFFSSPPPTLSFNLSAREEKEEEKETNFLPPSSLFGLKGTGTARYVTKFSQAGP